MKKENDSNLVIVSNNENNPLILWKCLNFQTFFGVGNINKIIIDKLMLIQLVRGSSILVFILTIIKNSYRY